MSKNKHMENLYDSADKFINLANILVQEDNSGTVGAAMRFASARYSVFELSLTRNIAKEKEAIKEELLKDYTLMIEENLNVYIRHQAEKAKTSKLKVFA
ncbi:MAG: DUF3144 domain-containing protein [Sulfurimonas sp.]|nr:DUF3144 domain-containing protein [Sulfurimonas sp.]